MENSESLNMSIPIGFRFTPNPNQILNFLRNKQKGDPIPSLIPITNMIIYGNNAYAPYQIASNMGLSEIQSLQTHLYFFTQIKRVSRVGSARVVGQQGKWKTDRTTPIQLHNQTVGYVTILKFENNNGQKFLHSWLMKEYRISLDVENDDEWVICNIYRGKTNNNHLNNNRTYSPPTIEFTSLLQLGYNFRPKDEELVDSYLYCIATGKSFHASVIEEINVYADKEPWEIFQSRGISKEDQQLYFFSKLKNKFDNGNNKRMSRQVGCGKWNQQGKIAWVKNAVMEASKTSFHFSRDKRSTGWIMHEFRLKDAHEWAVCTIYYQDTQSDPSSSSSTCNSLKRATVNNGDHDFCPKNKRRRIPICNPDSAPMVFENPPLIYRDREHVEPSKELCALTDGKDENWDTFTWAQLVSELGKENTVGDFGISSSHKVNEEYFVKLDDLIAHTLDDAKEVEDINAFWKTWLTQQIPNGARNSEFCRPVVRCPGTAKGMTGVACPASLDSAIPAKFQDMNCRINESDLRDVLDNTLLTLHIFYDIL